MDQHPRPRSLPMFFQSVPRVMQVVPEVLYLADFRVKFVLSDGGTI